MAFKGLKDLFIISDEKPNGETKTPQPVTETKTKFPTTEPQPTSIFSNLGFGKSNATAPVGVSSDEHIAKAVETYEKGFDSLNQTGYDFYEFYKTVQQGGADNPQVYQMCFTMGSAMDKSITKEKLLQQADYYISEITKVYNDNVTKGNVKKQDLTTQKNSENQSLVSELDMMKQQLEALKIQIQDRENKLNAIGGKYEPKLSEIESKLAANDIAKNKIINSIEQVKQGVINNLK